MKLFMMLMLGLNFSLYFSASAQDVGNGRPTPNGGGYEGEFAGIRDEISDWISKNQKLGKLGEKLRLKTMSGAELKAKYDEAVEMVGKKIIFNNDKIEFIDVKGIKIPRICKNEDTTITCNIGVWEGIKDGRLKYLIVFHEFLGVAGIEINQNTPYSDYPISPNIVRFVHSMEAFELGMEEEYPEMGGTLLERFKKAKMPKKNFLLNKKSPNPIRSRGRWDCYDESGRFSFDMIVNTDGETVTVLLSGEPGYPFYVPTNKVSANNEMNILVFNTGNELGRSYLSGHMVAIRAAGTSLLLEMSHEATARYLRKHPDAQRSIFSDSLLLRGYYECRER